MRLSSCAMYTDLFYLIRVFTLLVKLLALRKQKYMIKVVFMAGSHKPLSTYIMLFSSKGGRVSKCGNRSLAIESLQQYLCNRSLAIGAWQQELGNRCSAIESWQQKFGNRSMAIDARKQKVGNRSLVMEAWQWKLGNCLQASHEFSSNPQTIISVKTFISILEINTN